jgi:hypothetical protein
MEVQQKPFEVLEAELEKYYDIRGRDDVKAFVEAHPYLEGALLVIPDKLKEYFGYTEKPGLYVVYDVDIPSDTALTVDVPTDMESEAKFAIEDRLYHEWWYDVTMSIRHQIVLSIY